MRPKLTSDSFPMLRTMFFLLTFGLASMAAGKPTPPLSVTAAFDRPAPALREAETVRVRLATTRALTDAGLRVELPSEVALVSGALNWQGNLAAGEERELVFSVSLLKPGRYSIKLIATLNPAEAGTSEMCAWLNIVADARGTMASMEPFERMDMQRARSAAEEEKFSALDAEEELVGVPAPAGATLQIQDQPEPSDAPDKDGASSQIRSTTITVSGQVQYYDSANNLHPIRYAQMAVINVKNGTTNILGTGYSKADGSYSIRAVSADNAPNLRVCVVAQSAGGLTGYVGSRIGSVYYMQSSIFSNYTSSSLSLTMRTGKPVLGSITDSNTARIFSIFDAILQAYANAYAFRNYQPMPAIPVIYPGGGTASFYDHVTDPANPYISILRVDALDWDAIMHEYGHFVAHKGTFSHCVDVIGGKHDGGTTIPVHQKDYGVRLAWSEAFATWFSIISQVKPTQNFLALPGVPNSGDCVYDDIEDANFHFSLETPDPNKNHGYAAEISLQAMLYDLCDNNADTSSDGKCQDTIALAPKTLWNFLNSGSYYDVGRFYNGLCSVLGLSASALPVYFQTAQIFVMTKIAPQPSSPAEGEIVSSAISPTFKWIANGDPTPGHQHNRFALIIGNRDFSRILWIKSDIAATEYTFSSADWQAIVSQSDDTGRFRWAVIGYNDVAPRMPIAGGIGGFLSNYQGFQVRAYHIRLRWALNGADVDLHLRPPSGADYSGWNYSGDCAYYNRNPDWGVIGDTRDNPSLDRDCIYSGTEENITLDMIRTPGTYKVVVHYYNDHYYGSTLADVTVFRYGRAIAYSYNTLTNPQHNPSSGTVWTPFRLTVRGQGPQAEIEVAPHHVDEAAPDTSGDLPATHPLFLKDDALTN